MKAVVDTNVLVAGILTKTTCRTILTALKKKRFTLINSPILFDELLMVINRPKFHALINSIEVKELVRFIFLNSRFVEPMEKITICRDIKDNKIIECTLAGKADIIVTGDKDLLALAPFRKIPIVTPAEFIKKLK